MIVRKSGPRYFEMVAGAYLFDRAGHELRHVRDRAEVLAFLQANPDQTFELSGSLRTPWRELALVPDFKSSVVCGLLSYDSETDQLASHSFEA